jgi:hypothetical protein
VTGALVLLTVTTLGAAGARAGVEVMPKPAEKRVDVLVDGRPFTAYVWPERLKKPVLFVPRSSPTAGSRWRVGPRALLRHDAQAPAARDPVDGQVAPIRGEHGVEPFALGGADERANGPGGPGGGRNARAFS